MTTEPAVLDPPVDAGAFFIIRTDVLRPSDDNPRRTMAMDDLADLAESIKARGIVQPLLVRPSADAGTYEVVAGHRRLAAAELAGLSEVPCIVRALSETDKAEIALIENLQRVDLSPLDEATAYAALIKLTGASQRYVATRIGRSQSHISKRLGLLALPPVAVDALDSKGITVEEATALARVPAEKVEQLFSGRKPPSGYQIDEVLREHEHAENRAVALKELAKAGVAVVDMAPGPAWKHSLRGPESYGLQLTAEEHAGEPCHVAWLDRLNTVHYDCTDPDRHGPGGASDLKVPERSSSDDAEEPGDDLMPEREERAASRTAAIEARRAFAGEQVQRASADDAIDLMALCLGGGGYTEWSLGSRLADELLGLVDDTYNQAQPGEAVVAYMAKGSRNRARVMAALAVDTVEHLITRGPTQLRNAVLSSGLDEEDIAAGRAYLVWLVELGYELSDHDRELFPEPEPALPDPDAEGADEGLAWYTGFEDDPPRWITDEGEMESIAALYPDRLVDLDGDPLVVGATVVVGDGTDLVHEVTVRKAGRKWATDCTLCGEVGRNTTEDLAEQRRDQHVAEDQLVDA